MNYHLSSHREGFPLGLTEITNPGEFVADTGIGLAVLKLKAGEKYAVTTDQETAWLLMSGEVKISFNELDSERRNQQVKRTSLFDDSPICLHVCSGIEVQFEAVGEVEFTRYVTANNKLFPPRLFTKVANEHRGAGQVDGACLRFVRTIFDAGNSDKNVELVLGEVVTMPGRWSSYPPHHHEQPEIYHYRFNLPQGFGFAQLGEEAYQIRHHDTIKITGCVDHSQAAAPGYGMWYSWVIRHLPDLPYTIPEFTEEHRWTMDPKAEIWFPEELASRTSNNER